MKTEEGKERIERAEERINELFAERIEAEEGKKDREAKGNASSSNGSRRRPEDCRMRRGIHHRHWNRLNSPFSRGAKILSKSICFHKTPLFFQSHRNQHSPNVHVA